MLQSHAWVEKFAAVEGGGVITPQELVDLMIQESIRASTRNHEGDIKDLLSRTQIEEAHRRTRKGSAPEPDGITVDLILLSTAWSTVQRMALFLKTALYIQEPPAVQGRLPFRIIKKKKRPSLGHG